MRLPGALVPACLLAACARHLPLTEVKARPGDRGDVVVEFTTDRDLFDLGVVPHGQIYIPRQDPEGRLPAHCWVAKSQDAPVRVGGGEGGGRAYTYRWEFPGKAEGASYGPVPGADARRGPVMQVFAPYDVTAPGTHEIEFRVVGPVCGCRPVLSDVFRLEVRVGD
jgi:hypothetical protein